MDLITGNDLIRIIQENHLEEYPVYAGYDEIRFEASAKENEDGTFEYTDYVVDIYTGEVKKHDY